MTRPWSRPIVVAAIALGTCHLAAQTASQQPPAFSTGVELVTVDVTVLTRSGEPRADLRLEDFTLTVDGSPRRIVSMRLLRADTAASEAVAAAPAAPVPPDASAATPGRRFVLVIDREHVGAGEGQAMLAAAAKFVDALPAEDRLAVWTLPHSPGALRFQPDRDTVKAELLRAVGTYRRPPGQWMIARDEAVDILDGKQEVLKNVIARECYKQYPGCPSEVEAEARVNGFDWRQRAEATLSGLRSLVEALGAVEGPKHLVLITAGPVFTQEELSSINLVAARSAAARVTIHALQVAEPPYQASTEHMRPTPMQIDQAKSAAYALAGQTGGLAITPSAPEIAFNQLRRELSASYVVAFEPLPGDRDGKPHDIRVGVRDAGWGASVRARRTFRIDPGTGRGTTSTAPAPAVPEPAPGTPAAEVATAAPPSAAPPLPPPTDTPPSTAPAPPLSADLASLTDALAAYAGGYEEALAAAVAEERYVQITHPWRGNPKGPDSEPRLAWQEPGAASDKGGPTIARRQLVSDVLLVQVRDRDWMCYRDVAEVDGAPVRNRADRVRRPVPVGLARPHGPVAPDRRRKRPLQPRRLPPNPEPPQRRPLVHAAGRPASLRVQAGEGRVHRRPPGPCPRLPREGAADAGADPERGRHPPLRPSLARCGGRPRAEDGAAVRPGQRAQVADPGRFPVPNPASMCWCPPGCGSGTRAATSWAGSGATRPSCRASPPTPPTSGSRSRRPRNPDKKPTDSGHLSVIRP